MWNNYWAGRARHDVPQVNYNESSEDEYDSPLVSPARPPPTRAGSPQELAIPTLSDNVDEELDAVRQTLRNVSHTHTFRGSRPEPEGGEQSLSEAPIQASADGVGEAEVVEGQVVGAASDPKVGDEGNGEDSDDSVNMPNVVNFDAEDGQDGDKAADRAGAIKIEFMASDVKFWFVQLEDEMTMATIKSQWLKRSVLQRNLPLKQKGDVKAFLTLQKADAGPNIYLDIKTELLRIYAPKPHDSYRQALTRTMVGLPSQLGYQIIDDICKKPKKLDGCCCAAAAFALISIQLPVNVRAHISNMNFTPTTYKDVLEAADQCYLSSKNKFPWRRSPRRCSPVWTRLCLLSRTRINLRSLPCPEARGKTKTTENPRVKIRRTKRARIRGSPEERNTSQFRTAKPVKCVIVISDTGLTLGTVFSPAPARGKTNVAQEIEVPASLGRK